MRHDAPLDQSIAVTVAVEKRILNESRNRGAAQMALAVAGVLEAAHQSGQPRSPHLVEYALFLLLLLAPAPEQMLRHAVRKTEANALHERSIVHMGVVAT